MAYRFVELNSLAATALRDGQSRIAIINDPSLVHIFWLLDLNSAQVQQYVELLLDSSILRSFPHTKFWAVYSQAIAAFCHMPVTIGLKPKLVGYEKFWEPYLDFMAGSISRENFKASATASFAARNGQSRCIDWRSLDGDGKNPVRWDFRFASIAGKAEPSAGADGPKTGRGSA